MAIVSVTRSRQNERADDDSETQIYRVLHDSKNFSLFAAKSATDGTTTIPAYGEALELGSNLTVISKTATTVSASPYAADVEVKFGIPQLGTLEPQPEGQTEWGFTVTIEGEAFTEPAIKDISTNKPIKNSAGDPYDPTLEKEYYDERITASKSVTFADTAGVAAVRGKINSDVVTMTIAGTVRSFAVKTLKFGNIAVEYKAGSDGNPFYRVTLPLLYRADTWVRKVPDMGFNYLDSGDKKRILDDQGQELPQASFLDGSGEVLASGADAVLLSFEIDEAVAFSTLLAGF